jgi:chromosome segregation ATPase
LKKKKLIITFIISLFIIATSSLTWKVYANINMKVEKQKRNIEQIEKDKISLEKGKLKLEKEKIALEKKVNEFDMEKSEFEKKVKEFEAKEKEVAAQKKSEKEKTTQNDVASNNQQNDNNQSTPMTPQINQEAQAFEQAIADIDNQLVALESRKGQYPSHSQEYRDILQQQLALLEKKKELIAKYQ